MTKSLTTFSVLLLFGAILCGGVVASSAGSFPPQKQPVSPNVINYGDGWRFGVGAAVEYNNVNARFQLQPAGNLGVLLQRGPVTINQFEKQIQGAPSIEFGKFFAKDFYLGVQASWRFSGAKNNTARTDIVDTQYLMHEFKLNHYANILLKPGIKLNPCTMAYGLFGLSIANWRHTTNHYSGVEVLSPNRLLNRLELSKTAVGLGFGVGLEYLFRKNYSFSLDYVYQFQSAASQRDNFAYISNPLGFPINNSGTLNRKLDLSYGTLAARFTWFFNL